jgi:hypothetical protein
MRYVSFIFFTEASVAYITPVGVIFFFDKSNTKKLQISFILYL